MKSNRNTGFAHWYYFIVGIFASALVALSLIVYASSQRIVDLAEALAIEDAGLLNWWYQAQRVALNSSAASLASRVDESANFEELVEQAGLAENEGYIAWISADKSVLAERNTTAKQGDPSASKMFAYVPAINQPAADFWHNGKISYLISIAPVSDEKGGGVVVIQRNISAAVLENLANTTGRDVVFYSFEEQEPLVSSNPQLVTNPLSLDVSWVREVATSQQPQALRANNDHSEQVVGMTAFSDFAGISYSGYLALVEPFGQLRNLLPQTLYWIIVVISLLWLVAGCFLLQRNVTQFLQSVRTMEWRQKRAFRWRSAGLLLFFLLPVLAAGWFIIKKTSEESWSLNLRTGQIAQNIVFTSFEELTGRINQFATDPNISAIWSGDIDDLAEKVRAAASADFAVVVRDGKRVVGGFEELSENILEQLVEIPVAQTEIVLGGKSIYLAAKQMLADGSDAVVGVRLDKQAAVMAEAVPADLTLLRDGEILYSSLSDREIEGFSLAPSIEERLNQEGEVNFTQNLSWYNSKLAVKVIDIREGQNWRLLVSQRSVTWNNTIRAYQAFGAGVLAIMTIVMLIFLASVLNQDKPLLLRRLYTGFGFILPAGVWLIWWQLGPALFTGYLSFHKWSVLNPAKPYVGLHNYRLLWTDEKFWNAMGNTFYYLMQIPISLVLALALALALNRKLRGIKFLRTIYYMPAVTSIVVVALMWQLLYNKDLGIFNYLLSFVGLGPYGFLQSTTMAMPSIMGMEVWLGLGARMLLFLAGLQSISNDYYEAAEVDGAGAWPKFRHITAPLLAPTTFFVFTTAIIQSFQVFGPIYVLTSGGPAGATDVAVYRIWFEAWQNLRFGYASAETVVLFAFLFIVTALQFRYFGRNVSYG